MPSDKETQRPISEEISEKISEEISEILKGLPELDVAAAADEWTTAFMGQLRNCAAHLDLVLKEPPCMKEDNDYEDKSENDSEFTVPGFITLSIDVLHRDESGYISLTWSRTRRFETETNNVISDVISFPWVNVEFESAY